MGIKRICIFMHRFDGGGAEKMTVILANELHKRGYEVTFCVREDAGETRALLDDGIPVLDMQLMQAGKLYRNLKNISVLHKLLGSRDFDLMLSITTEMSMVAAAATFVNPKRISLIEVSHNALSMEVHSFQKIRELLFPLMDRRMDGVITVSEAARQDYIKVCRAKPEHVKTIYNPVISQEVFGLAQQPVEHPWLKDGRSFHTIILAGRLSYQKNHQLMLRALQLLRKKGDYRLLLLGTGELLEELKAQAKALGIEAAVEFAGYVGNPYAYYAKADCVALSSRYEGLPTVLIEALACGARVVSTDCPCGPREILADGKYGVLVPMEDEKALADGIVKALAQTPDRELLKKRSLDFSVERSADAYEAAFRKFGRKG